MNDFVIETKNLCKLSGTTYRVKDLSMRVPKGVVYGFLGPNGAGKTTTMKLLLGLIHPNSGSIKILGQEMNERSRTKLNTQTGSLIENPGFYGHLTGQENLEIIAKYKQLSAGSLKEALQTVHLWERKDDKVKTYSLGMKQRLGIAMALMGEPPLMILDEPTNGLDPAGMQEMRALIKSLPGRFGTTVLISSHLLSEIEQMADYAGIIHKGEFLYQGPLSALESGNSSLEEVFLQLTGGEA
jgi:ABC-2 type transport system ATP-binding protein